MSDRVIDRVLDPHYVSGLGDLTEEDLRQRIEESEALERVISGQRRAMHRVIHALQSELDGRA